MREDYETKLKQFIIDAIAKLGHGDKQMIATGIELYAEIGIANDIRIKIGDTWSYLSRSIWDAIRSDMRLNNKIYAVKKLRAYMAERYDYTPGIKEAKDAVENISYFPV